MFKKNIPNTLTALRGFLTLFIIFLFFFPLEYQYLRILLVFIIAATTDFFDGYLARKWQAVSDFGKIFDPLLDKILIISMYFLLIPLFDQWLVIIFILLMIRDLVVDGLKNYMLSKGEITPAILTAKLKTSSEMLMIASALAYLTWSISWLLQLTYGFGILAIILAYFSGLTYYRKFFKYFNINR